mmetsp:Transcript_30608/g.46970  ORF Transcript_30608/g.46970 Transcript_30608/m.46970 type:complete len:137 (-) Transcript_30608:921-1331(-)
MNTDIPEEQAEEYAKIDLPHVMAKQRRAKSRDRIVVPPPPPPKPVSQSFLDEQEKKFDKLMKKQKQFRQRLHKERIEAEAQEIEECTFAPQINKAQAASSKYFKKTQELLQGVNSNPKKKTIVKKKAPQQADHQGN